MKHTLTNTVQKFSDVRIVQGELDAMLAEPRREAITMMFLVVSNIPPVSYTHLSEVNPNNNSASKTITVKEDIDLTITPIQPNANYRAWLLYTSDTNPSVVPSDKKSILS